MPSSDCDESCDGMAIPEGCIALNADSDETMIETSKLLEIL